MKRAKREETKPPAEERSKWPESALWWLVGTIVLATSVVVSPSGKDLFRLPKDLLFRGGWIALLTVLIVCLIHGRSLFRREDLGDPAISIPLACLVWAVITTLASTNLRISAESLLVVCGSLLFFLVSLKLLPDKPMRAVFLVIVPALVNGVLAALQKWTAFQPIELEQPEYDRHLLTTGLMGNPNDVGTLLVGPILLVLAGSFVTRGRLRMVMIASLLILIAGLLASETLTAILATTAGILVMTAVVSWKKAAASVVALALAGLLILNVYPPMAERAQRLRELSATGDYNALLTNRLTSFRAAEAMFREHPITGVGPGAFGWNYFDYKLIAQERHPELALSERGAQWSFNFGEVHNDHLEIAAETGLPGWLLYMAALVYLGSFSFRNNASSGQSRASLARLLALPLAIAFAVLALAQFPLQLAGPRTMILFLAALCITWSRSDGD